MIPRLVSLIVVTGVLLTLRGSTRRVQNRRSA
jgi:hypothetical protein